MSLPVTIKAHRGEMVDKLKTTRCGILLSTTQDVVLRVWAWIGAGWGGAGGVFGLGRAIITLPHSPY